MIQDWTSMYLFVTFFSLSFIIRLFLSFSESFFTFRFSPKASLHLEDADLAASCFQFQLDGFPFLGIALIESWTKHCEDSYSACRFSITISLFMLNPLSIWPWPLGITKTICISFHKFLYLPRPLKNFWKNWSRQSLTTSKLRKSSWYLLTSLINSSYYNLALSDSFDDKCLS